MPFIWWTCWWNRCVLCSRASPNVSLVCVIVLSRLLRACVSCTLAFLSLESPAQLPLPRVLMLLNLSLCIFAPCRGTFSSSRCAESPISLVLRIFPSFVFTLCLLTNAVVKCSNFSMTFLGEVWVCVLFVLTQVICISGLFYGTWCRISNVCNFLCCISGWEAVV